MLAMVFIEIWLKAGNNLSCTKAIWLLLKIKPRKMTTNCCFGVVIWQVLALSCGHMASNLYFEVQCGGHIQSSRLANLQNNKQTYTLMLQWVQILYNNKESTSTLFFRPILAEKWLKNGVAIRCVLINGMEWGLNCKIPSMEHGHDAISYQS